MVTIDFAKGDGIVPVIIQDHETNDVLMLAYMNQEAWEKTLSTGKVHYYSPHLPFSPLYSKFEAICSAI